MEYQESQLGADEFGQRILKRGGPMQQGNWWRILILSLSMIAISGLHFLSPITLGLWYNLFHHLYVLPIVVAAIFFGWRGGVAAAGFAALCYAPYLLLTFRHQNLAQDFLISQGAELFDFFLSGLVTGILADRERRQKRELEKTNQQLSVVYRELQNNFEQMKRSERLYALGQLSAGLAHEIRNPLAGIEGAALLVRNHPDASQKREECLDIIQKECSRLKRLVTNFLEFARPRSPQYHEVQLELLFDSVIGLASHAIGHHPITFQKRLPPNPPSFSCDPEQIKQILINLTINAIQAMPEGGEILLAAAKQGEYISLQVQDQGQGIDSELLDKIFDPFFTTKEYGTGMGLSVAHQIVAQHGGSLTAQKNAGLGMTFSVLLPLHPGSDL
jgi:two-component system sensor histidine kinase HydH